MKVPHSMLALLAAAAVGPLLASCADQSCTDDSECPAEAVCARAGGVFFQSGTCVTTGTSSPDTSMVDAGRDVGDSGSDEGFPVDADPPPDAEPTCTDGVHNGGETDVDCGGDCPACEFGDSCSEHGDCASEYCDGVCGWPRSCREWRLAGATDDGTYRIDADGEGDAEPVNVHCDMTSDQGVGYTMVRVDDPSLGDGANQSTYREACARIGMEIVVPRTRAHALSIVDWNDGEPPNIVNVYPDGAGFQGLHAWHGVCQGEPCRFWMSDTDSAGCQNPEPNGDNTIERALTRIGGPSEACPFGAWNDDVADPPDVPGWVICSTNDAGPPLYGSCLEILDEGSVQNVSEAGISGPYTIAPDGPDDPVEVFCDMVTDGGGYTFLKVELQSEMSGGEADSYCAQFGMQLFIPRTRAHRDAAVDLAQSDFGPSADRKYLSILAIYADAPGARCDLRPFHSDNMDCHWSAADGGPFFITNRSVFEDPNGSIPDLAEGHSLEYQWNGNGSVSDIGDVAPPGWTSRRFVCDVGDKQ